MFADPSDESKQKGENIMAGHKTAMEAPHYKSYKVYIFHKMRSKVEIHLGISGEKIELDPVQQKTSKIPMLRMKAESHNMDSVAHCDIFDTKSSRSVFRVVYCPSFNNLGTSETKQGHVVNLINFKHYDFEADHKIAEEIVQKINLILELRSSICRKEYLALQEKKLYRRKSFTAR